MRPLRGAPIYGMDLRPLIRRCRIKTAFFNTSRDHGIELVPAPVLKSAVPRVQDGRGQMP